MLKPQKPDHGGIINNYNAIFFIIIGIHNIIDQLIEGQNVIERWHYTAPFLLLALIVYIIPNHKIILSYMFLIIAIITHIDAIDPNGFNSAILFLMAYINNKKRHMFWLIIFLSFSSIIYRSGIAQGTPSDAIILVVLYIYFFVAFYKEAISVIPKPIKSKLKTLTAEENKILELMCSGYSQEKAGAAVGYKDKHITSKAMKEIREKLGIQKDESTYKAIALYLENGK